MKKETFGVYGEAAAAEFFTVDGRKLRRRIQRLSRRSRLMIVALMIVASSLLPLLPARAIGGNMILFWDPANGSVPAGWCLLSIYDGFFPRGETVANTTASWGTTFPTASRPYTPTTNGTPVLGAASVQNSSSGGAGTIAAAGHTHNVSINYTSEDNGDKAANPNLPAFRSLQLMMYGNSAGGGDCTGNGIPNVIPANAIALFNNSLPASGWTQVSAQNARFLRVNSAVATGGGDTEFTDVTITGLAATGTTAVTPNPFLLNANAAPQSHTHSPPSSLTCTSGCATPTTACALQGSAGTGAAGTSTFRCTATGVLPNYVQPLLGKANSNTSTLALNMTAMFDDDPGNGWVVRSGAGDVYNQKFLRPNSTASLTAQGAATHTISLGGTYGNAIGTGVSTLSLGNTSAGSAHNHSLNFSTNTVSNIPPYFNIVIAEKVSFTLQHYQWFVDSGAIDLDPVNGPWPAGAVNLGVDKQLSAIPAPYQPPDNSTQLRLRIQILVSGQNLAVGGTSFKLQFAPTGTVDCITGSWTDVDVGGSGTAAWRYGTNGVAEATLTVSRLTPASSVLQRFSKTSAGGTVPNAATTGQTIEYDWLIQNNGANGATQYAFRPIETNGTLLGEYNGSSNPATSKCPSLITRPSTDQLLRHGEFFLGNAGSGSDPNQGFIWAD